VAPRVHLKAFGCQLSPPYPPGLPQEHGDFSQEPFWDPAFWQVSPPARAAGAPVRAKATEIRTKARLREERQQEYWKDRRRAPNGPTTGPTTNAATTAPR
jgi:hypothetical protein